MSINLDAIKARLAAPYAAGAYDITVRLADGRLCATVRMRDWDGNTAHDADAAVTRLLGNAPADLTVLVAEVERLRGEAELLRTGREVTRSYADRVEVEMLALRGEVERERAAVVAWLREVADTPVPWVDDAIRDAALAIERGEHRSEGEE
jgi:hypothetical protein